MGRKSAKSSEKKLRRKEEKEMVEKLWILVKKANEIPNPLEPLVSFQSYTKNGLRLSISCQKREQVEENTLLWAFDLTKRNMEAMYEECGWGWSDKGKMTEMKDDKAIYLVARSDEGKPVAFVHFRFDLDYGMPVVYCYEIQLEEEVQRHGLGHFLMHILQLFAIKNELFKVMATVIKDNRVSLDFFMKKMKFVEDETSPDEESYIIVSKIAKTS